MRCPRMPGSSGSRLAKRCLRACAKRTDSDSAHACTKCDPGICSQLIHSIMVSNSVSRQRRPWSYCANAQADLGHCCPHIPEDTFSQGVGPYICTCIYEWRHQWRGYQKVRELLEYCCSKFDVFTILQTVPQLNFLSSMRNRVLRKNVLLSV